MFSWAYITRFIILTVSSVIWEKCVWMSFLFLWGLVWFWWTWDANKDQNISLDLHLHSHCHFRIWTQRVTFETWGPSVRRQKRLREKENGERKNATMGQQGSRARGPIQLHGINAILQWIEHVFYSRLKVSWAFCRTKSLQLFSLLARTFCLNCTFLRSDYIRMSSSPKRKHILSSTWKEKQNCQNNLSYFVKCEPFIT